MGGKGKKRREKNYRAAHGGAPRLPPPPTPSSLNALPSKLRQIMSFSGAGKASLNKTDMKKGDGKGPHSEDLVQAKNVGNKRKDDDIDLNGVRAADSNAKQNRNRKRKRKEVKDLRFETTELGVTSSKRKERKKQRLEARKKKHKKANADEDFPGREEIKFGEVVEAPPKLIALPKVFKNAPDASKERLRLQAVEAYRNRKGWASRPGIQISPPITESPLI